ncbi:hypothetical protein [Geodermatophilus sp. SYSU D00696]
MRTSSAFDARLEEFVVDEGAIAVTDALEPRQGRFAGVDQAEDASVALDSDGQQEAAERVVLGGSDLVRPVRPERHLTETDGLQHVVARCLSELQILVLVLEVDLQGVDALEPGAVRPQVASIRSDGAESR